MYFKPNRLIFNEAEPAPKVEAEKAATEDTTAPPTEAQVTAAAQAVEAGAAKVKEDLRNPAWSNDEVIRKAAVDALNQLEATENPKPELIEEASALINYHKINELAEGWKKDYVDAIVKPYFDEVLKNPTIRGFEGDIERFRQESITTLNARIDKKTASFTSGKRTLDKDPKKRKAQLMKLREGVKAFEPGNPETTRELFEVAHIYEGKVEARLNLRAATDLNKANTKVKADGNEALREIQGKFKKEPDNQNLKNAEAQINDIIGNTYKLLKYYRTPKAKVIRAKILCQFTEDIYYVLQTTKAGAAYKKRPAAANDALIDLIREAGQLDVKKGNLIKIFEDSPPRLSKNKLEQGRVGKTIELKDFDEAKGTHQLLTMSGMIINDISEGEREYMYLASSDIYEVGEGDEKKEYVMVSIEAEGPKGLLPREKVKI